MVHRLSWFESLPHSLFSGKAGYPSSCCQLLLLKQEYVGERHRAGAVCTCAGAALNAEMPGQGK